MLSLGEPIGKSRRSASDEITPHMRLTKAIRQGQLDEVKKILKTDINILNHPDPDGAAAEYPIHVAAECGHASILTYLIDCKADVNAKNLGSATSAHFAAVEGHLDCLEIIDRCKGDLNHASYTNNTALMKAAARNKLEIVEYLISRDVNLNARNQLGETALFLACALGHSRCVRALVDAGADVNIKDNFGWAPYSIANEPARGISNGVSKECIAILESAGAIKVAPPEYPLNEKFFNQNALVQHQDQDVDMIKVQTMWRMVEEAVVNSQGKEVKKKVLYLTNKQAALFDEEAMERCIQALDLGEPKLVLKLCGSLGVSSQMKLAHPEKLGLPEVEYEKSPTASSEIDRGDEEIVETQLLLFMKNVVLPLAMQTRALILVNGANNCYLSAALSKVAVAEQARLGRDCPFTVIAIAHELEVHAKASSPNTEDLMSVASQLARQSTSWQKRIKPMNEFYSDIMLCKREKLQQCDLTDAAERYIIFEGYDESIGDGDPGSVNRGPQKLLESVFLQYMTRKLPSIAIQCLKTDAGVPFLVDLTSRNIPVLLLDTTERCFTKSHVDPVNGPLTRLARDSHAFPTITKPVYNKIKHNKNPQEVKSILLELAFDMIRRKMGLLEERGIVDSLDTSLISFFHCVLNLEYENVDTSTGAVELYKRIRELEKHERTSKDTKRQRGPTSELAERVMDFITSEYTALDIKCQLQRVERWINSHDKKLNHLLTSATELKKRLQRVVKKIDENGGRLHKDILDTNEWLATYDLLTSPNAYSCSLFDFDHAKRILGSVAKIDRLPNANTLEGLRILADAWDHVELYNMVANRYKLQAKITYLLMLLIGIAITVFTLIDGVKVLDSKVPVIVLSFIGTFVSAYVAFINPAVKWQALRMAALSIESNIWTFRTRAGPYRTKGEGFDQSADKLLSEVLKDIKEKVVEGGDIKQTNFFAQTRSQNLHKQHPSTNSSIGALDNFSAQSDYESKSRDDPNNEASIEKRMPNAVDSSSMGTGLLSTSFSFPNASPIKKQNSVQPLIVQDEEAPNEDEDFGDDDETLYSLSDVIASLRHRENDGDHFFKDMHYEPLQPEAYIRFRILTARKFYQDRIPKATRTRNLAQILLVAGTVGSAILGIAGQAYWASLITIFTASITAYLEFSGTNSKISRYSFTVHALSDLLYWWQCLPAIDRSVVANVDRLVLTCEEILQREQQAWRSTSQTVRMLQKASEEQSTKKDD